MEFEFDATEDPTRAQAEAFQEIARQLKRIADAKNPNLEIGVPDDDINVDLGDRYQFNR